MNPVPIQSEVELREYGIVVFAIKASTSKSGRLYRKRRVVFGRWRIRFEIYCSDSFNWQSYIILFALDNFWLESDSKAIHSSVRTNLPFLLPL